MSDERKKKPTSPENVNNKQQFEPVEIELDGSLLELDEDNEEDSILEVEAAGSARQAPPKETETPDDRTTNNNKIPQADEPAKIIDTEKAEIARQNSMVYPLFALVAIAAVSLLQIWLSGKTGLGDAEAYYYAFSKNLSLSYYDHPPGVAYLISLGTFWLGDNVLGVRVISIIISAMTAFMLYLFTTNLFNSGRSGLIATLLFLLTPVIFIGGSSAAPDVAMVLMWLFASWLLSKSISKGDPIYLMATGIIVGVGMLCKYFMVLFWPAAILYLLFARGYKLLFSIWFLLAIVFSLLFFAPVLVWNYQHDWISFTYHLVSRHSSAALDPMRLLQFVGGQALYLSPLIFLGLVFSIFKSMANMAKSKSNDPHILFWLTFPVLAIMYLVGAWTPEAEPHWTLLGYVLLYPTLGNWLANASDNKASIVERILMIGPFAIWFKPKRRNLILGWMIGIPFIILALVVTHLTTDILSPYTSAYIFKNPKHDISYELTGWDKVGLRLNEEMSKLDKDSFVASYHYTMCGQLNFATKNKYPLACLSKRTDAFDFFANQPDITDKQGIFVTDNRYNDDPNNRIYCENGITLLDEILIIRGGIKIRKFSLYRCNGYKRMLTGEEHPPKTAVVAIPEVTKPVAEMEKTTEETTEGDSVEELIEEAIADDKKEIPEQQAKPIEETTPEVTEEPVIEEQQPRIMEL